MFIASKANCNGVLEPKQISNLFDYSLVEWNVLKFEFIFLPDNEWLNETFWNLSSFFFPDNEYSTAVTRTSAFLSEDDLNRYQRYVDDYNILVRDAIKWSKI